LLPHATSTCCRIWCDGSHAGGSNGNGNGTIVVDNITQAHRKALWNFRHVVLFFFLCLPTPHPSLIPHPSINTYTTLAAIQQLPSMKEGSSFTSSIDMLDRGPDHIPKDDHLIVMMICTMLGISVMFPWNAIITALDYFSVVGTNEPCCQRLIK
jgi:hypothetical protein